MSYKPSILTSADGGTGVSNSSSITLGGAISTANSLTTSGNFALTLTTTNTTNITLPTSGTIATTQQIPSALPVPVSDGGTGRSSLTNHGVLIGATTTAISQLAAGSAGQVLQSGGASADPAYSTSTFPSIATGTGKVLIADGTNWVASTPTYPNVASTALKHIKSDGTNFVTTTVTYPDAAVTAGKVMVSDGSNYIASTPTFPNASATSGKIIKSDGTNWIASTETYAAPGTSGNIMSSDGTNWTSASPTVYTATLNLTNAQIKALFTTPITIVAAQGAGTVITVYSTLVKYTYGGTNAFTGGGALNIRYTGTAGQSINAAIMTAALIQGTASVYSQTPITAISGAAIANMENQLVCIHNLTALFTGNAANNNLISVKIWYGIASI